MDDVRICLDPKKASGLAFISHAHSDHIPRSIEGMVITSHQTKYLSNLGCSSVGFVEEICVNGIGFQIIQSGHMLGSGQLLIKNGFNVIYSGDFNLRGGVTTEEAKIVKADVLIVESTYGSPFFKFPERAEVVKEIRDWIDDTHSMGKTPCLLAYSFGKAQELTRYLAEDYLIQVHPTIYKNNKKYEKLGVYLGEYSLLDGEIDDDYVVILPPRSKAMDSNFRKGVVTGWALRFESRRGIEGAFPLSDHSDFYDLIHYVEEVDPQIVYTIHGFCEEFSEELRSRGFYSEPLRKKGQLRIEEFI
jgi:Cft2 family RNA processing exonuclease